MKIILDFFRFFDLKIFHRLIFKMTLLFVFVKNFRKSKNKNVLHDEINTVVHFYWIRITRTILRAIRPFWQVVVTPERIPVSE